MNVQYRGVTVWVTTSTRNKIRKLAEEYQMPMRLVIEIAIHKLMEEGYYDE